MQHLSASAHIPLRAQVPVRTVNVATATPASVSTVPVTLKTTDPYMMVPSYTLSRSSGSVLLGIAAALFTLGVFLAVQGRRHARAIRERLG